MPIRSDDERPSASGKVARQLLAAQQSRPHRIVEVVVDVGDDVGDARDLSLDGRGAMLRRRADRQAALALRVPRDAVAHFPREVQALPIVFEHIDDAQALFVVVEPAGHERAENALAGVAERRVAEVVPERDRFGQLFVQAQHLGDGARDLRDLERVRETRAVVIAGRRKKDLRLVLQPAKRLGVDDAIAVALKRGADGIFRFGPQPALAVGALGRGRRENLALAPLQAPRGWSCVGGIMSNTSESCAAQTIAPRKLDAVRKRADAKRLRRASGRGRRNVVAGAEIDAFPDALRRSRSTGTCSRE